MEAASERVWRRKIGEVEALFIKWCSTQGEGTATHVVTTVATGVGITAL